LFQTQLDSIKEDFDRRITALENLNTMDSIKQMQDKIDEALKTMRSELKTSTDQIKQDLDIVKAENLQTKTSDSILLSGIDADKEIYARKMEQKQDKLDDAFEAIRTEVKTSNDQIKQDLETAKAEMKTLFDAEKIDILQKLDAVKDDLARENEQLSLHIEEIKNTFNFEQVK